MATEKRLIDANALLKEIDGIHQRHYANSSYQFIHDFFLAMFRRIKNAPTVDAVEVVRCKDCDYYEKEYRGFGFCKYFDVGRADNDFCSSCIRRYEE